MNLCGPHASPSVAEQWRHDVDQLVVATINTPPRRGRRANHFGGALELTSAHSRTPTVACTSLVACVPMAPCVSAASLATVDLWAELEHRRLEEDDYITIERHQERHCNLDGDFVAANTTPMRQVLTPIHPWDLGVVAWHLPHTSEWRCGRASFGPTCWRSTTGASTLLSSCRSTPPSSSLQEVMRPS
jgi:hypothetical protein